MTCLNREIRKGLLKLEDLEEKLSKKISVSLWNYLEVFYYENLTETLLFQLEYQLFSKFAEYINPSDSPSKKIFSHPKNLPPDLL